VGVGVGGGVAVGGGIGTEVGIEIGVGVAVATRVAVAVGAGRGAVPDSSADPLLQAKARNATAETITIRVASMNFLSEHRPKSTTANASGEGKCPSINEPKIARNAADI
jgi:hypothetical protein